MKKTLLPMIALLAASGPAWSGTLTLTGTITQSTADGTGPAVNLPSLNNILDGQNYTLTLTLPGPFTSPGTYATGATLLFSVPAATAVENEFDAVTLVVSASGTNDELTILGCLTTGSGCLFGNSLSADFSIPASMINGTNVAATGLSQPVPLDLLEDDGVTDIHGTITNYSYSAAPEPAAWLLTLAGLTAVAFARARHSKPSRAR